MVVTFLFKIPTFVYTRAIPFIPFYSHFPLTIPPHPQAISTGANTTEGRTHLIPKLCHNTHKNYSLALAIFKSCFVYHRVYIYRIFLVFMEFCTHSAHLSFTRCYSVQWINLIRRKLKMVDKLHWCYCYSHRLCLPYQQFPSSRKQKDHE